MLLSFPACLAPLLVLTGLYNIAYIALAAALATWSVRLVWFFPGAFRRLVMHSLPILLAGSAVFAGWKGSQIALGEQQGNRGATKAAAASDEGCSWSWTRSARTTWSPRIWSRDLTQPESLGEGVTFGQAQATAPWTLPSHASMFTGLWPHETGVARIVPSTRIARRLPNSWGPRLSHGGVRGQHVLLQFVVWAGARILALRRFVRRGSGRLGE